MQNSPRHIQRKSILFKLAGKVSRFLGASCATKFNISDFFYFPALQQHQHQLMLHQS